MLKSSKKVDSVAIWGVILLLIISTYTMHEFLVMYKEEKRVWEQENQCVRTMVAKGIERRYIATGGGTCWSIEPQ